MSSFIRTCILIAMASSSLACDDGSHFDSSTLRPRDATAGSSGGSPVFALPPPRSNIEGLDLHYLPDPATASQADETPEIELKVRLKIVVHPCSEPANVE